MAPKRKLILTHVNEAECKKAGLNPRRVEELARQFGVLGRKASRLGLTVFGGTGKGTLRFHDGDGPPLIVGEIQGGNFDGGCGAYGLTDSEGLLRGE